MDGHRIAYLSEEELDDGTFVLSVAGELDVASAPEVRSALRAAQARGHPRIVVDLSGVPLVDSTGLSVLVVAHKRLRREGRELLVVIPESGLMTKFHIAGLDRLLSIAPSRAAALR